MINSYTKSYLRNSFKTFCFDQLETLTNDLKIGKIGRKNINVFLTILKKLRNLKKNQNVKKKEREKNLNIIS